MTEYKVADEKDMELMMNSRLCFHVLYYDHAYVLISDRQKGASDECIHRKNIPQKRNSRENAGNADQRSVGKRRNGDQPGCHQRRATTLRTVWI